MAITVSYPFPENKPSSVQPNTQGVSGSFSTTTEFTGFIPGRRYTLVISGYNGHTTQPNVQDNGEWGPALADGAATSFWNDEIVMPTDTLQIEVTAGTGDLHFTATLIK